MNTTLLTIHRLLYSLPFKRLSKNSLEMKVTLPLRPAVNVGLTGQNLDLRPVKRVYQNVK